MRAIFQNKALPHYKNFWKIFVQYVTVWFVRIWIYKNADEKQHSFHGKKNVHMRRKNGYCVKMNQPQWRSRNLTQLHNP